VRGRRTTLAAASGVVLLVMFAALRLDRAPTAAPHLETAESRAEPPRVAAAHPTRPWLDARQIALAVRPPGPVAEVSSPPGAAAPSDSASAPAPAPVNNPPPEEVDPYELPDGAVLPPDTRVVINGRPVGLEPKYLVPVPEDQRPSRAQLEEAEAEALEERALQPPPGPPDQDLLTGLLVAIRQVKENPALRLGLINSYLDAIAGLDDPETAEAMKKLEEARRESASWAP